MNLRLAYKDGREAYKLIEEYAKRIESIAVHETNNGEGLLSINSQLLDHNQEQIHNIGIKLSEIPISLSILEGFAYRIGMRTI
jgi:hypothetical protein